MLVPDGSGTSKSRLLSISFLPHSEGLITQSRSHLGICINPSAPSTYTFFFPHLQPPELIKLTVFMVHRENEDSSGFMFPEFTLTPGVKEGIKQVKEEFSQRADSILLNYIQYGRFGKNFLKKQRLSPDGMMQLAIQVCFFFLATCIAVTCFWA